MQLYVGRGIYCRGTSAGQEATNRAAYVTNFFDVKHYLDLLDKQGC